MIAYEICVVIASQATDMHCLGRRFLDWLSYGLWGHKALALGDRTGDNIKYVSYYDGGEAV